MLKKLSLLLLTGCMANDSLRTMSMSQDNVWNLSRLSIGMDESEVLQIMHYPYKKQVIENHGVTYHIWFYVTRPSGLPQSRLVRQNLTPLTFESGVLQGWGFAYYDYILKPQEVSQEKPQDLEQKSLQRAIEGIEKNPKKTSEAQKPPSSEAPKKRAKKKEASKTKEERDEHPDDQDNKMIKEENEQNFDFW